RSRPRLEICHCLVRGSTHVRTQNVVGEVAETTAPTTAAMPHFTAAVAFCDDCQRQAYQRTYIGSQAAVAARYQHHVIFRSQASHNLDDVRISSARHCF